MKAGHIMGLSLVFLLVSGLITAITLIWVWRRHNDEFPSTVVSSLSLIVSVLLGISAGFYIGETNQSTKQSTQRDALISLLDEEINLITAKLSPSDSSGSVITFPDTTMYLIKAVIPTNVMKSALISGLFAADTSIDLAATISMANDYNLLMSFLAPMTAGLNSQNSINNSITTIKALNRMKDALLSNCRSLRNRLGLTPFEEWKSKRKVSEGIMIRPRGTT